MNEKLEKQIDKVSYSRNCWFATAVAIAIVIAINVDSNRRIFQKIDDFEENFEFFVIYENFYSSLLQNHTVIARKRTHKGMQCYETCKSWRTWTYNVRRFLLDQRI